MYTPHLPARQRLRNAATAAVALGLALSVAACSDDDSAAADVPAAACNAFVGVSGALLGDPSAAGPVLDEFVAALPQELTANGEAMVAGLQAAFAGDQAAMSTPEFTTASAELGNAMFEGCGAEQLDVKGIDFGFEGLPEKLDAGRVAIRFTNETDSGEMHEMFIVKRNDGTTESFEELYALPEEELFSKVTPVGVVFTEQADGVATTMLDLEAGEYIAVCNIPVGGGETGDPHAMHGMVAEFVVA